MGIDIKKLKDEDRLTVLIEGNLDTNSSPVLKEALEGELDGIKELVIDLNGVSHISSAGVRVILLLLQNIEQKDGTMKLINANEMIVELLDTIGFLDMLTVEKK
jgi:anti-anti-sigma factor